jgi:hypothetical protein
VCVRAPAPRQTCPRSVSGKEIFVTGSTTAARTHTDARRDVVETRVTAVARAMAAREASACAGMASRSGVVN